MRVKNQNYISNQPSTAVDNVRNLIGMRNFNMDVMTSILDKKNLKQDEEGAEQEKADQEARRKGEKAAVTEPNEKKKNA